MKRDIYKCPNCGEGPLSLGVIEIEADVTDDVLYCDSCEKYFEIIPGKEIKGWAEHDDSKNAD